MESKFKNITDGVDTINGYMMTMEDKTTYKYYAFDDDQPMVITRTMLNEISKLNKHVVLVTNAGVDIHSSEGNKFKNVTVVKESYEKISKGFA